MKTDQEIAVARHLVAAHDANFKVSPFQRAALHGMRSAFAMNRFELPKDKYGWIVLLNRICDSYRAEAYNEWSPLVAGVQRSKVKREVIDWVLMRDMCAAVEREHVLPDLHRGVLVGFRLACAWVLGLPQGWVVQQLWDGGVTGQAIGVGPRDAPQGFNFGAAFAGGK